MRFVRFALGLGAIGLIFLFGFGYGRWYSTRPEAAKSGRTILYYVDSMHPWYRSDKPGVAPDCGMKLTPVYADGGAAPAERAARYRDPQDPTYTSDKPGINQATGNDLQPITEEPLPAGAIRVSADKQQAMGIRTGQPEWTTDGQALHLAGRVAADETHVTRVHAKVEGWIEHVSADFTGQQVKEGQPLLTLYSPELLATQQELLLAVKARDVMQHSSMAASVDSGASLLNAARRRLELWDLAPAQIADI